MFLKGSTELAVDAVGLLTRSHENAPDDSMLCLERRKAKLLAAAVL